MGLTNAVVYKYRKLDEGNPLRSWQLACGVAVYERLMLPNLGSEALAFYSYLLEFYNKLPNLAVFFLHDHGEAWHVSCSSLAARSRLWYQEAVEGGPMMGRMISFTSQEQDNITAWYGGPNGPAARTRNGIRGLLQSNPGADVIHQEARDIAVKWKVPTDNPPGLFMQCCASFIVPSKALAALPAGFYRDMLRFLAKTKDTLESGKAALEFSVWRLFSTDTLDDTALAFYNRAKEVASWLVKDPALVHCQHNTC
ncbi:hypothetical protein HYH03_008351 [Edaphochlamys debaryana]|uniref:Uncharacterized protein n=1 Tax=Edaphochlamys debaryana TaxID=47281 RepID=A0A835Y1K0_9CHLO|nr:hypothetical protein HYH03_008351 [Edaphochlamys debaryana]|eukprot:KAG2493537.1 hypothetical protein HYH03_008351 [Edaphochlamys debaryana]